MAINAKFTREDIKERFDRFLSVVEKRQIMRIKRLGEICVKHARLVPPDRGFTDRTGNLRSSIGYMVFKNGMPLHENYKEVNGPQGGNSAEAISNAKGLAQRVAQRYPNDICLVVTAGMNYAAYVESTGRDVITSAEILAKSELPRMIEELAENIHNTFE